MRSAKTSRRPAKVSSISSSSTKKGFPFIVLEAKAEDKSPLVGKEQARQYARSQNCHFVLLSNGNLHYFWDLARIWGEESDSAKGAPPSQPGATPHKR